MWRVAMMRSYANEGELEGRKEKERDRTLFIATASDGQSFINLTAISGRTLR
jgi:hypothetical protein